MNVRILILWAFLSGSVAGVLAGPAIHVQPEEMLAGSHQHVRFEFMVGDRAIEEGGGVRIELPVAYLETEPYYWDPPQTDTPGARGHVAATAGDVAQFRVQVTGAKGGIVECMVTRGRLAPGDKVILEYAGVVQSLTWSWRLRAQWRAGASDEWQDIADRPVLRFLPQGAACMLVVLPADVGINAAFDAAVVLLDKYGNRAGGYRGTISFQSNDPRAVLPATYTFSAADDGVHVFTDVRFGTTGFRSLMASDGQLEASSNHCDVGESMTGLRRYFGETHFHTGTGTRNKAFTARSGGGDHRGHFTTQHDAYEYVRDVVRLDFASASEHSTPEFDESAWAQSQQIADAFYQPGRFTTFYGFEWTASAIEGHHVILYLQRGGHAFGHLTYPTKPLIWNALDEQNVPALMIPHLMWTQPDHGMWAHVNNRYRRVGEIYSLWNNRYLVQPGDEPQRFELGPENRWSYQNAWRQGHRIGLVGSTDNHTGRPGMNNYTAHTQHAGGLACVWATDNTRESIWDAMQRRRTYATTGTRILLKFKADGHWMGEEYAASAPPKFEVAVAGTNRLESVEIVKLDGAGYRTIHARSPEADTSRFEYSDATFAGDSMYYLRVTQVPERATSPWAHTTAEMAWSSPIWISDSRPPGSDAP